MAACVFIAIMLMSFSAPAADAAQKMDFGQARETMLEVSDILYAGQSAVEAAKAERDSLHGVNLPTIGVSAQYIWTYKTASFASPLGPLDLSRDYNGMRYSADVVWPIYTGGRMGAARRALDARVEMSKAALTEQGEQIEVVLVKLYYGASLAKRNLELREAMLEQSERQLKRAERFRETGQIAKIEYMTSKVARDEAEREAIRARRDKEIADAALQRFLKKEASLEVSSPLFVNNSPLEGLEEWLRKASLKNGGLEMVRAMRKEAEEGISAEQARWKPEILGVGMYNFEKNNLALTEPDYLFGIQVRFTLFSGQDRGSKIRAAKSQRMRADRLYDAQMTDVYQRTETHWRRVEAAREQFNLIQSTLDLAKENLRLKERSFEEGLATSLDVSEAANALNRAQLAQAYAAYEYTVALAELLSMAGESGRFVDFQQNATKL